MSTGACNDFSGTPNRTRLMRSPPWVARRYRQLSSAPLQSGDKMELIRKSLPCVSARVFLLMGNKATFTRHRKAFINFCARPDHHLNLIKRRQHKVTIKAFLAGQRASH